MTTKMDGKFYGEIRKAKNDEVVPEDRWVCFLVQDDAFAAVLPLYREKCAELGADLEQLFAIDRLIDRVDDWRRANPDKCKVPDAANEKMLG